MSFRRLLDREVTIVPREVTGTDARGNDVVVDGDPIENVKCSRDLDAADEENTSRDQQEGRYVYFFGPEVILSGFDVILDDGYRYEVKGPPELVRRRRRGGAPHHLEAIAERIGPIEAIT